MSEAAAPPPAAMPPNAAQRVAIVDDDVRIRTLLRLELEDLGAEVLCYASAEEAIAGTADCRLDLVLLDVGLPGMDGLHCLRQLRQAGLAARVVLMSGHWTPLDNGQLHDAGADGHVLKTDLPALLAGLLAGRS